MRSLVISPFAAERIALAEILRSEGYEVTAVADRSEGLALAGAERPDAVIADAQVPGLDGRALVRDLAARGPMPCVILLCPRAGRALESKDVTCLTKPIDLGALHQLLARLAAGPRAA
jgi:CheY-like chemotaxis protein